MDILRLGRRPHRATLAAYAVAPGALLAIWGIAIEAYGPSVGGLVGLIPATIAAGTAGALVYGLVNQVSRANRSAVATTLVICMNLAYIAAVAMYMKLAV